MEINVYFKHICWISFCTLTSDFYLLKFWSCFIYLLFFSSNILTVSSDDDDGFEACMWPFYAASANIDCKLNMNIWW